MGKLNLFNSSEILGIFLSDENPFSFNFNNSNPIFFGNLNQYFYLKINLTSSAVKQGLQ